MNPLTRKPSTARTVGLTALLVATLIAAPALAQSVHWEDPDSFGPGQRGSLDLTFEDSEPAGALQIPRIDGLTMLGSPSQQSRVSVVNGKTTSSFTLSYPVRLERQGAVEIPAFQVKTSEGPQTVAALKLEVSGAAGPGAANAPAHAQAGGGAVIAEMNPSTRQPYAGEVFDVGLVVGLAQGRRGEVVGSPEWQDSQVVAEPWGEGRQAKLRGAPAVKVETRAMAPKAGSFELSPVRQEMRVDAGRDPRRNIPSDMLADMDRFFDDSFAESLFSRTRMSEVTAESNTAGLDVRALPKPHVDGFTGAVGQFELESKMVPENAKTGEPVTWTLTLRGTGNWPGGVSLPPRAIPSDFRTLQPKQQRDFPEKSLFTGAVSEDLVLIPSTPGTYELPPVRFVYFDPTTEKYETTVVEPPALSVSGAAIATGTGASTAPGSSNPRSSEPGQTSASSTSGSSSNSLARATTPVDSPSPADARLPHQPQAGVGVALSPMQPHTWLLLLAAPFAALAMWWTFLAARRARLTDPQRRRREALKQLAVAIETARRGETRVERRPALLDWQHAAAVVLEIDFAAPTPAHLKGRSDIEAEWTELWTDADRALYGRGDDLEAAWYGRAQALCRRIRRPRHNPLRAFLPHNLLPKMATAALLLAMVLPAHAAPADDYAAGDFTAARDAWKAEAEAAPGDWVARYNLGLAEAQLGETGRALGETAAAFLHHPRNASVLWNLGAFAERVPGIDSVLSHFAAGEGGLAAVLSPASWQLVSLAGALLFCLAGGAMLRRRYTAQAGDLRASAAALALGALIGLSAWACLHRYAHLAHPNAALLAQRTSLHSVPTDAEDAAAQRPLEAGAVVVAHRNFLGWSQVELPDGEDGWVRSEMLVPLYPHAG